MDCACTEPWKTHELAKRGHQWWCGLSTLADDARRAVEAEQAPLARGPWSLLDVLARLTAAADHLLKDHDCDTHGHEEIAAARDAARMVLRSTRPEEADERLARGVFAAFDRHIKPPPELEAKLLDVAASTARSGEDEAEKLLRRILDADPKEPILDAARRRIEELIEWRGACEGAFGIMTANPRKTLVNLASAQVKHHREHHLRERRAWNAALALAKETGRSAAVAEAEEALAALDEQGLPE